MEHYRSTLAATALAVFGLITAAHILHPGNYETQPRPVRPIAVHAEAAPTVAWMDPPAALRPSDDTARAKLGALDPSMTLQLPPGVTMAPTVPAELKVAARRLPRTGSTRRKAAQRASRVRHVSSARQPIVSASPRQDVAQEPKRANGTIDDLLRGLGLGPQG